MNESLAEQVRLFVADWVGARDDKVTLNTTLDENLGLAGNDAEEFFEAYRVKFDVDLTGIDLSRHFYGEGCNPLGILLFPLWSIFRPQQAESRLIPITVKHLVEVVQAGRWIMQYPPAN